MFKKVRLRREREGDISIKVLNETFFFRIMAGDGIMQFRDKMRRLKKNDRVSMYFKIRKDKPLGDCFLSYKCNVCPHRDRKKNICTYEGENKVTEND